VIKKREDVGVELYSLQQQLARLQALLEATEDSSNTMKSYKEEAERKLRFTSERHKEELEKLRSHSKNCKWEITSSMDFFFDSVCFYFGNSGGSQARAGKDDQIPQTG
jgi:hypothetical protein